MIIFHEGLPGSGKSYAAFADHIIPALKKGRKVFCYIEGLNFDKIAEAAGLSVDDINALLFYVPRAQVPYIYDYVGNDSLVVIDELQNFWPSGRSRLDDRITQFVTEHRHRGLDVLVMGQVLGDCHALWKGRVDTKITFMKRDAVGKSGEYKWTVFKNVGGRFKETTSGKKSYDSRFFGCYASHTQDTTNLETYSDDRANVKNSRVYKFVRAFPLVVLAGIAFIVWFFVSGGGFSQKKPEAKIEKKIDVDPNAIAVQENAKVVAEQRAVPAVLNSEDIVKQAHEKAHEWIDDLNSKGRIRLGGSIRSATRITGLIEWRDGSNRVIERFTPEQLQALGWYVMLSSDGGMATISKSGKVYVATQWPIVDDREAMPSRVPEAQQEVIRGGVGAGAVDSPQLAKK